MQLRSWADDVLNIAGPIADLSVSAAQVRAKRPNEKEALRKAGAELRSWRESLGITLDDLAQAVDLRDCEAVEEAEQGVSPLPFEVVLRLSAVLGRRDPGSFVMKMTRAYSPELWKTLEGLGVGRLMVQVGREREFANLYRAHDAARQLSDAEFASLLSFLDAAVKMALGFRRKAPARKTLAPQ
ncbi:MAG: helix-turn-helix transcriptional regulator [Hyphomicrobiales bacterium]|jgi:transcriptional regulator with XRE-family HTH domain|nr:helix-turn-helix transcriptional regulator [Hyphomicrobiales bacterium]